MASITKNKLADGGTSYRIQVKYKDHESGNFSAKVMTWKQPEELTEYQAQKELRRVATEFEQRLQKQQDGLIPLSHSGEMKFCDYATEWLERTKRDHSLTYYAKGVICLKHINKYIGNVPLNKITPVMIQKMIDDLSCHVITHNRAKLKPGINLTDYCHSKCMKQKDLEDLAGLSRGTIHQANKGENIMTEKAEGICKALGVPLEQFFIITNSSHGYSKESIIKYRRFTSIILATAKRQRLVEHNFASGDYLIPIKGYKKEIRILNDQEAKVLATALQNEKNIRWKTALMIVLFMGIRRGELAGLEWKDIDFEKRFMKISRSCYDVQGFGRITKEPKTELSKRVISIPDKLLEQLQTYKEWWKKRKYYFSEIWGNNDRLFISDEGKEIQPSLYITWLKRILKKSGLPEVSLHSLRHTNITLQLIAGIDLKTVSARAGHARASTTSDFYSHYIRNSDIHASEMINKLFE